MDGELQVQLLSELVTLAADRNEVLSELVSLCTLLVGVLALLLGLYVVRFFVIAKNQSTLLCVLISLCFGSAAQCEELVYSKSGVVGSSIVLDGFAGHFEAGDVLVVVQITDGGSPYDNSSFHADAGGSISRTLTNTVYAGRFFTVRAEVSSVEDLENVRVNGAYSVTLLRGFDIAEVEPALYSASSNFAAPVPDSFYAVVTTYPAPSTTNVNGVVSDAVDAIGNSSVLHAVFDGDISASGLRGPFVAVYVPALESAEVSKSELPSDDSSGGAADGGGADSDSGQSGESDESEAEIGFSSNGDGVPPLGLIGPDCVYQAFRFIVAANAFSSKSWVIDERFQFIENRLYENENSGGFSLPDPNQYQVGQTVYVTRSIPISECTYACHPPDDWDQDGIGDDCDPDVPPGCAASQVCSQLDANGDGVVNSCDSSGDVDGDGLSDSIDATPWGSPSGASGSCNQQSGLRCDEMLGDYDGDDIINGRDDDIDGDGVANGSDPTPHGDCTVVSECGPFGDVDGDGVQNQDDPDSDGDGIPNNCSGCPILEGEGDLTPNGCGCGLRSDLFDAADLELGYCDPCHDLGDLDGDNLLNASNPHDSHNEDDDDDDDGIPDDEDEWPRGLGCPPSDLCALSGSLPEVDSSGRCVREITDPDGDGFETIEEEFEFPDDLANCDFDDDGCPNGDDPFPCDASRGCGDCGFSVSYKASAMIDSLGVEFLEVQHFFDGLSAGEGVAMSFDFDAEVFYSGLGTFKIEIPPSGETPFAVGFRQVLSVVRLLIIFLAGWSAFRTVLLDLETW